MPTVTIVHTFTDDNFHRLSDLGGLPIEGALAVEGLVQAQANGVTVRMGDGTQPAATANGVDLTSGQGFGFGPSGERSPVDLRTVWVRNETAGANATVIFVGRVL